MEKKDEGNINKIGNKSTTENQHPPSQTNPVNSSENTEPISANKSQLKTEMEVHHHPQLDHKSKPFKEYLLEGFMIFIAVMMGFIAENIRVNITDSEHVNQLTSQLVQGLKNDTARLNKIWGFETQLVKDNDSLIELLQKPLEKTDTKRMQKLITNSHGMWPFHPSGGAIAAIKNELPLKQFSNSDIIRYIAIYEEHIDLLHTVEGITLQYQRSYLDPFLTQHFTPSNMEASFDTASTPGTQMRNLNQEDMAQLAADMVLIKINTRELVDDNRMVKDDAVSLLKYVIKHYHK
ncbi:MAG TPA: hypothetical protein VIJ95_11655 [Hanamia sp.]